MSGEYSILMYTRQVALHSVLGVAQLTKGHLCTTGLCSSCQEASFLKKRNDANFQNKYSYIHVIYLYIAKYINKLYIHT